MKIHFEGTHKELLRVFKSYLDNVDYCVMESSQIIPKGNNTKYWCLDMVVISKDIYEKITTIHDDEITIDYDTIFDSLPVSIPKRAIELLNELIEYVRERKWNSIEDIQKKVDDISNELEISDEEWREYELNYCTDEKIKEEE